MKTKHPWLHEVAKFASGLVAADFFCGWWLAASRLLPISFLGVSFTADMVLPWMVFDAALFIILIHYGWNIGKMPVLEGRTFLSLMGIIFGVVALAHLGRIFLGGTIILMGWVAPFSVSWIAVFAAGYLSYMSFHLATLPKK